MRLQTKITESEYNDLHEALQVCYELKDGVYVLDVEGTLENVEGLKGALRKERKLADEAERRAKDAERRLAEATTQDPPKADSESVGKITDLEKLVDALQGEVTDLRGQVTERDTRIDGLVLVSEVQDVARRRQIRNDAVLDAVARAREVFRVEDGKLVARTPEGDLRYGSEPDKPLDIDEWVSVHLRNKAPHLFAQASGGGSHGTKRENTPALTLTREQASNRQVWKQTQERAAAAGAQVRIAD